MHQLGQPRNLTNQANWWGMHLSRRREPPGLGKGLRRDPQPALGQHTLTEGRQGPQCTIVGRGGLPPSSPDRGVPDTNRYSTASEMVGRQRRHRGRRGSRERKRLAPARLDMPIFKECLGAEAETEQGKMFFCIHNSLVLNKGLMYVNTTPKGETEGVLAFVVPAAQCCMVLNGGHRDTGHQGQQRTLALAQERFWWPMMAEDC